MAVTINIPSQVRTFANLAAFPATGAVKTIYIAEDTNKTYRWTGSVYVEISASAAMTWGQIGGTLSNQTDLQNALDAKVPTSRTLTINGVAQDLSADRTFTIATGLTVGTTPISSGTIGRVLFQGTGNVLQQSSSLFWDGTNNRLGIGTSTPTFRLEVQGGDVRFANGLTIGTAGSAGWQFSSNTVTLIQNGFVSVDFANGREFSFTNASFSTTYLKLASVTGNVLINTTTDAGFRLDVNGTARVSPTLTINGTAGAAPILQLNANGFNSNNQYFVFRASNADKFQFGYTQGGASNRLFIYNPLFANDALRIMEATNNVGINTTTDAGFRLDVNGTARVKTTDTSTPLNVTHAGAVGIQVEANANGYRLRLASSNTNASITTPDSYLSINSGGQLVVIGSTSTYNSAQVAIDSTTKGFLPPRMTTTQKNAIASPATGLQIYDTTLNRPCFYDGTTWITL
jgi:hypothetical protein